jgi:predicted alpha/beta superfamily hydrolase
LGNQRTVTVLLPKSYTKGRRTYPVLYLHDGQNVFDGARSYIPNQEWRADETTLALARARLIPELIVVAIDNAEAARADEFLPTRRNNMGGKADAYGRFVTQEVMPFIDRAYRTRTSARDTALVGSSFGGVITAYLGMRYPNKFGKLGICSPSVWWDRRILLELVNDSRRTDQRLWIDMGTAEGANAVTDARALRNAYAAKGWRTGRDLAYVEETGAEHNERAWAGRFGEMLMFLFRR